MTSNQEGGLSLWLSPTGEKFKKFQGLINSLAKENPGCLEFEPHMTLISDDQVPIDLSIDDILKKVSDSVIDWNKTLNGNDQLEKMVNDFEIRFDGIEIGQKFYQCVYARVKVSDSLSNLNTILRKNLIKDYDSKKEDLPNYFPHLSLIYGESLDESKKVEIKDRSKVFFDENDLVGFEPVDILLVKTMGKSTDWIKLAKIDLRDGISEKL